MWLVTIDLDPTRDGSRTVSRFLAMVRVLIEYRRRCLVNR
jgi:hypothetical protein